ncbi:uncharacterized protein (TIGR00369 family) [Rhodoblastus acidophilus]|nr:PaaI family thioesterase [Rhodoblastus acidophilus]MCW2276219.1 uncharacterized protein (TIGR00369 family) [Rhodoblastus acidophilus]
MRPDPKMSLAEVEAFLEAEFPQLRHGGRIMVRVESVGPMTARLRLHSDERHLRPGGTVSGPAMFMLVDVGIYVAILAQIGPVALAVTTNLNINFLRKPPHGDILAEISLLKLGKRLAVGEATLFAEGDDEPVAHAVGTYSIPPR